MRRLAVLLVLLASCSSSPPSLSWGQPTRPPNLAAAWFFQHHATTTTTTAPVVQYSPSRPDAATLERLRVCECPSGWHCNTGNGYFGGLQMDMDFWIAYGGLQFAPRPDLASPADQMEVARRAHARRGWRPWPTCSRKLGLR